jgi:hypothetical protein
MPGALQGPSADDLERERQEIHARTQGNARQALIGRNELIRILPTAPLYLASTHGEYDLTKELVFFELPDNVHVFEISGVSELVSVSLDNSLWELIQNRVEFQQYLFGSGTDSSKNIVLSSMRYYKPFDIMCDRELTLGEDEEGQTGRWGYYKVIPGVTPYGKLDSVTTANTWSLINYIDPLLTKIRKRHYKGLFYKDNSILHFIREIRSSIGQTVPLIFVINSCGAIYFKKEKNNPEHMRRFNQIMLLQERSRLNAISMGIHTGSFIQNSSGPVPRSRAPSRGTHISRHNSATGINESYDLSAFSEREESDFYVNPQENVPQQFLRSRQTTEIPQDKIVKVDNMVFSCTRGICSAVGLFGGTRRVKRKSKGSRKTKKTRRTL